MYSTRRVYIQNNLYDCRTLNKKLSYKKRQNAQLILLGSSGTLKNLNEAKKVQIQLQPVRLILLRVCFVDSCHPLGQSYLFGLTPSELRVILFHVLLLKRTPDFV